MKKIFWAIIALVSMATAVSCDDAETYAEQKDKERAAISRFIKDSSITVISEAQFKEQGYKTDVSKNEFVLFQSSGLYLQIIRKGTGSHIATGETARVLCRFTERNLLTDSIQLSNTISPYYYRWVETMTVTNNSGTFSGSFDSNSSLMSMFYGSTTIPSGWLAVLPYINFARYADENSEIAQVRIIVPHDLGQTYAMQNVYPCLYDITFERGR